MGFVGRVWKDPVWSKVISVGIVWLIAKLIDRLSSFDFPRQFNWALDGAGVMLLFWAVALFLKRTQPQPHPSGDASPSSPVSTTGAVAQPYQIGIHTDGDRPYHDLTVDGGHRMSTVRVGIRNAGEKTLSNCRVYVEKVTPPAGPLVPNAILLETATFNLRTDDPEHLVEIAGHWEHLNEFRFSAPMATGFFESMQYMDDSVKRTFVLRVSAREYERSALFEIWADEAKELHLKFRNYVN